MSDSNDRTLTRGGSNGGNVANVDGPAREGLDRRPVVAPPVDIHENSDEILVVADVPGARSDSILVKLEKNELYLYARRDEDTTGQLVAGRPARVDYSRTFLVPRGIDAEKIAAEMNAGVLKIHLPKSESLKPRRIEIRAA
jgi:HSP20 family molecular chaperone IbpA